MLHRDRPEDPTIRELGEFRTSGVCSAVASSVVMSLVTEGTEWRICDRVLGEMVKNDAMRAFRSFFFLDSCTQCGVSLNFPGLDKIPSILFLTQILCLQLNLRRV